MVPLQLLLVEDDPQIVRAIVPSLEVCGHQVTVATNGAIGIALLESAKWDAIVLDLGLPDMDGREVLRHLRKTSLAVTIVISARHSPRDQLECELAGADYFLNKPFSTPELIGRLQTGLTTRQHAHPD